MNPRLGSLPSLFGWTVKSRTLAGAVCRTFSHEGQLAFAGFPTAIEIDPTENTRIRRNTY